MCGYGVFRHIYNLSNLREGAEKNLLFFFKPKWQQCRSYSVKVSEKSERYFSIIITAQLKKTTQKTVFTLIYTTFSKNYDALLWAGLRW